MIKIEEYKQTLLDELYAPYIACKLCPLSASRTNVVFGRGNPNASLLLVGEAPGKEEDLEGIPFIGKSGQLLSKTLTNLSIQESNIYITNIVKCRPVNNRKPTKQEALTCSTALLYKQIEIINPTVICTLGACSAELLIGQTTPISQLRGNTLKSNSAPGLIVPTYHPAYILRCPKQLPLFMEDLQRAFLLSINKLK